MSREIDEQVAETWKPIAGWEGVYSVSDHGHVRAEKGWARFSAGRVLVGSAGRKGYRLVQLYRDGRNHNRIVHRLVAEAFVPNPNRKPVVNHINGVKDDNRAVNLEWVTNAENSAHARTVLNAMPRGESVKGARLNPATVRLVRFMHHIMGISSNAISKTFGMSPDAMWKAIHGETWKHVPALAATQRQEGGE